MKRHSLALALGLAVAFGHYPFCAGAQEPNLMLANDYHAQLDLSRYLMSEKLDGVRAYWTGSQLLSRSGNVIQAPGWFVESLPAEALDGELWIGRGQFESLLSVVRDQVPDEQGWRQVQFQLFDLPGSALPFWQRYRQLQALTRSIGQPHIRVIAQRPILNESELRAALARISQAGGEGVMLHHRDQPYLPGRSDNLVKYKLHADAEAVVISHQPGRGKYTGMMGSIVVETADGVRFRIGSGFSDADRRNPPAIGSVITFRYNGHTERGIPRFARYLRPHPML
ncbi:DNA ligase [Ferrimonas sediminicola]|uniref:DNA ligase n=1 Tax=Ferrimonas sediminicola TaxID=2569538 RepID=A0A4V5NUF6_9GAMM|nr:DNA ligase [Ferrimonas sediminicola]TKB46208.1 DNA ligase [Ferrimonas sediminicola]